MTGSRRIRFLAYVVSGVGIPLFTVQSAAFSQPTHIVSFVDMLSCLVVPSLAIVAILIDTVFLNFDEFGVL